MNRMHTPDQFKTKGANVLMGLVGLVLAFLLALRALDSGSYWHYLGVIILLVLSIRLLKRATKSKR